MNIRNLAVVLAVGVLAANSAHASRARLMVMGTGDAFTLGGNTNGQNGSYSYDDAYNMFYNPSYINDNKNWAIIEKSNAPGTTAFGGATASFMNMNVGVFFNRVGGVGGTYATNPTTPLDIIVGGDMGVKWGLGLTWASTRTSSDLKADDMTLRAGVQVSDFEPFIGFKIMGTDKTTAGVEPKNKDMHVGVRYKFGEWTPYAVWRKTSVETAGATTVDTNAWALAVARNTKLSEGVGMNYSVGYHHDSNDTAGAGSRTMVPVQIGVEADVLSWMTARAGLQTTILNRQEDADAGDVTVGRVGGTFHFGKADVDFAFGTSDGAGANVGSETNSAGNAIDSQTIGLGAGLFTAMSLSYRW